MASVEIDEVRKRFGTVEALQSVSVQIDSGEFVALVGPSGCGKSTLLRLIAGLDDITAGEIRIGGEVVNELTPRERNIAMVFQNYALYPHMKVSGNMGFSLRMRGIPDNEAKTAVGRAAETLGLESLLARLPAHLSGGQRQRVAMGRAIVRDCDVFLFDEPLSNLDAQLRVQMRSEIKALHQKLKNTMIYVTHDQIEAMTMADKVVVLRDGRVEQVGMPLELYDRPCNTFVARFIGSPAMNLMSARLCSEGARSVELPGGGDLPTASPLHSHAGKEVTVGIRPEHVGIAGAGIPADVLLVEPTGSSTQLMLELGGSRMVCVVQDRPSIAPGSKVAISVDPSNIHLFDAESGVRINPAAA